MIDRDRCLHDILLFGTHEYLNKLQSNTSSFFHYMPIVM